jgi:predicted metal-dependent hydrolase
VKDYQLRRSNRKTIALVVNNEAELVVKAPLSTSVVFIEELIEKKNNWISDKQSIVKERNKLYLKRSFQKGESFMYLGNNHQLQFSDDVKEIIKDNRMILIPSNISDVKGEMIKWYKNQAYIIITERLKYIENITGLTAKSIRISDAKKRWGSCGISGSLNFSWHLVMCPVRVIDYVIAHEISHVEYRDHSKDFWIRVKTIIPDYEVQKKWLDDNQRLMDII